MRKANLTKNLIRQLNASNTMENNEFIEDSDDLFEDGEGENLEENQEGTDEEMITIPKKQYQTVLAQKKHWRDQATTKKEEVVEKKTEAKKDNTLSQTDLFVLIKANIHEDDISEVTDYATLKGISVAEALKSSVVKTILSEKEEERKTASATATGNIRKGVSKPNANQLINNAKKGVMPESDEDMATLVRTRMGL